MSETTLTVRIEALKIAAGLLRDVIRPDPDYIVNAAKVFEAYVTAGDNGKAAPNKRGPGRPPKAADN